MSQTTNVETLSNPKNTPSFQLFLTYWHHRQTMPSLLTHCNSSDFILLYKQVISNTNEQTRR